MQCAVIEEAFSPLALESRPIPAVPEEGLVLRTLYSGICHSDIHSIDDEMDLGDGQTFRYRDVPGTTYAGIILGHEICGEVLAKGSKVPARCSIKEGDTVVVYPFMGCRACEVCSNGNSQLCGNNPGGLTDIGANGKAGGYATHVPIPSWDLAIKLPSSIPPEIGCMLPCSVLCAYHTLIRAKPVLDSAVRMRGVANLLVVGAGGLGFWTIIIEKALFCDKNVKIIVADINQEKLTEVSNVGADDAILWSSEDSPEKIASETTLSGYNKMDAVIDFVGSSRTSDIALRCLHHGGTLILVGLHGGVLHASLPSIISRSVSVQGMRVGPQSMLKDLVDLFAVQNISTLPPIQFFTLSEVNEALDKLRASQIKGRAILNFTKCF